MPQHNVSSSLYRSLIDPSQEGQKSRALRRWFQDAYESFFSNFTANAKTFLKMKENVFETRPVLRKIFEEKGQLTLYEFSKQYNYSTQQIDTVRQEEFLTSFKAEVSSLLPQEVAESATNQMRAFYYANSTDHHGPSSYAGYVNSNLLMALPYLDNLDTKLKNIIVLSCADISFDNFSFPRGLLFHGFIGDEIYDNQLTFFGRAVDSCPVIYFKPYTMEAIKNIKSRIAALRSEKKIEKGPYHKLLQLIDEIYAHPDVLSCSTYMDQVTKTNYMLWQKLFAPPVKNPLNFVFVSQENIASRLLLSNHLKQDTTIHRLLFSPSHQTLLKKHFEGLMGAFSYEKKLGTHLFWALPKGEKYRKQLWFDGKFLVTEDGSFKLALTPENIQKGIEEKTLIPSILLIFMVISFYYGVRLLGGQNQTTYLTHMKEAYLAMHTELGDAEVVVYASNVRTDDLAISRPVLAFIENAKGKRVAASALDLVLYGNENTWTSIRDVAKNVTIDEALSRSFPNWYRMYYPPQVQEKEILAFTEEHIERLIGLDKKITSCAYIRPYTPPTPVSA